MVMKSFTWCPTVESTGNTRGRVKKAAGICDRSSLEMAENQMVSPRHAGEVGISMNYRMSQMEQRMQPIMGEKSKYH